MISRENAINAIAELESSGLLNDELTKQLGEIRLCIEAEQLSYHLWGLNEKRHPDWPLIIPGTKVKENLWDTVEEGHTKTYEERAGTMDRLFRFAPAANDKDDIITD